MLRILRELFIKIKVLNSLILFLYSNTITRYSVWLANQRKRNNDIFDYNVFVKTLPIPLSDPVLDNALYGISFTIKKYIGSNKKINAYIEHGIHFGTLVKNESKHSFVQKIITLTPNREAVLSKSTDKKIIVVGPYIQYADLYLSKKEFLKKKESIGKTLLVFPSHSIKTVKADFDHLSFIQYVKSIQKHYDTVLVNLYWKDIILGRSSIYEKYGFKVVTAGHSNDVHFLSRLRTIIEMSDFVVSNSVGTHTSYILALKKPQFIFSQEIQYNDLIKDGIKKEIESRDDLELRTGKEEQEKIKVLINGLSGDKGFFDEFLLASLGVGVYLSKEDLYMLIHV